MVLECKIAHYFGLPPHLARRKPLPLSLLWLNYISQAEGLETWWPGSAASSAPRLTGPALRAHLNALRSLPPTPCE